MRGCKSPSGRRSATDRSSPRRAGASDPESRPSPARARGRLGQMRRAPASLPCAARRSPSLGQASRRASPAAGRSSGTMSRAAPGPAASTASSGHGVRRAGTGRPGSAAAPRGARRSRAAARDRGRASARRNPAADDANAARASRRSEVARCEAPGRARFEFVHGHLTASVRPARSCAPSCTRATPSIFLAENGGGSCGKVPRNSIERGVESASRRRCPACAASAASRLDASSRAARRRSASRAPAGRRRCIPSRRVTRNCDSRVAWPIEQDEQARSPADRACRCGRSRVVLSARRATRDDVVRGRAGRLVDDEDAIHASSSSQLRSSSSDR